MIQWSSKLFIVNLIKFETEGVFFFRTPLTNFLSLIGGLRGYSPHSLPPLNPALLAATKKKFNVLYLRPEAAGYSAFKPIQRLNFNKAIVLFFFLFEKQHVGSLRGAVVRSVVFTTTVIARSTVQLPT